MQGQYVAWWVDHEETTSMTLVAKSHATEEECLEACSECLDDPWLADDLGRTLRETGFVSMYLVVADDEE